MSARPRVTRIPQAAFDALERGDINKTQFIVLSLLHQWANYTTGRVDSFCAERICRYLHIEPSQANLKSMRRQIAPLRDAGWFHDDYRRGDKRPYHVWLHNYVYILESDAVHENGRENVRDVVREEKILHPCEIKVYQPTIDFDGREDVPDGRSEFGPKVSATNQSGQRLRRGGQENQPNTNEHNSVPDLQTAQADLLLIFVWELVEFTRPKAWALNLLSKYSLKEIQYAIVEFVFSDRHSGFPADRALSFFFKEGLESIIAARRIREGSLDIPARVPPENWDKALEQIASRKKNDAERTEGLEMEKAK